MADAAAAAAAATAVVLRFFICLSFDALVVVVVAVVDDDIYFDNITTFQCHKDSSFNSRGSQRRKIENINKISNYKKILANKEQVRKKLKEATIYT